MSSLARERKYWRSLEELADTPEFREMVEREFPSGAAELRSPVTRRNFLRLMGASFALAGLSSCRWPREEILPFARSVENRTPGEPLVYATAMELGGAGLGLLVTSYDGRPIKVEGNPLHPDSRGATSALAQASVLELYDPDRSDRLVAREGRDEFTRSWDDFAAFARAHFGELRRRGGAGLHVLAGASSSLALARGRGELLAAFPEARWREYEPLSRDGERAGTALLFGRPWRAQLDLASAEIILCLDEDLLFDHPAALGYARDFAAKRRAADGKMNRLYVVESRTSITGAAADHRWALASGRIAAAAARIAADVLRGLGAAAPAWAGGASPRWAAFHEGGEGERFVAAAARDLLEHRGRGLVVAGPRQPAEVHAVAHLLNAALGNAGRTVRYTPAPDPDRPSHREAMVALAEEMRSGRVDTLLVLGANPVYQAPADLEFAAALARVKTTLHLGLHRDETGSLATWHLPQAHFLESWGDARAWDGTVATVQPLIAPLYEGKTAHEVLALVVRGEAVAGYDLVRDALRDAAAAPGAAFALGADFERGWRKGLHDGVLAGSAWPATAPAPDAAAAARLLAGFDPAPPELTPHNLEVVFARDAKVHDGRFANNAWLQELPDPLTRVTWENAVLLGPATAAALGVKHEDLVRLRHRGREIESVACVLPGHADHSITLLLGYGRRAAGHVGNGVGVNVYALRTSGSPDHDTGLTVEATGRRAKLACTQDHYAIDPVGAAGRDARVPTLVREGTLAEYLARPDFARHEVHEPAPAQLWAGHPYPGHRWGMAVDLNACIGCGACVAACQAENNIPVVGRAQVERGREMHWIRVDRYFSGPPEAPEVSFQPMTCHHCENAPCEQVCPVAATVHDAEGLNVMVYNRCIGTRYCANNCPYKVRRFNFLDYHRDLSQVEKMAQNPEVTVRSRGVMEKCTFCLQRITAARHRAKNESRPIRDGEVTSACAQACPTQAIVFGDLNDERSRVRAAHEDPRAYIILGELNTRPRLHYLARLRNPAPGAET